jgi:hypothetical protein
MSLLRLFVTAVVALPLLLAVGWPHPWWMTLLIAAVAISVGRGVELLVRRGRHPAEPRVGETTSADRRWELKMLTKKANSAEEREEYAQATALFEQVLQKADRQEDAEMARRHLEAITYKRALADGA